RPREELFRFWRHFQNLPQVMSHLESVSTTGPNLYHWVARGPMGLRVEWDAEVHTDRINELISWRSVAGSEVDTAGSVHFTPPPPDPACMFDWSFLEPLLVWAFASTCLALSFPCASPRALLFAIATSVR